MQTIIHGEQPFQVLSTSFTIGPSSSGYDLYFSADGKSYTNLFTVGANVNRQVTQVAAGSYYKLIGNTDDVTINWILNCESGTGGGGGGYVLPVATSDTLGGVKIGNGLTIDSGGTISVSGGSGSDAVVIDLTELYEMGYPERKALWDDVYAKAVSGSTVYMKGGIVNNPNYVAILPLEKYVPETTPSTHVGGFMYFSVIDADSNTYLHLAFSSAGNITGVGTGTNVDKFQPTPIYTLPKAAVNTLGGVKVGSGLTIDSNGTLSVSGGSSDENYIIADALSAITDPTEGQMATVESTTAETVWTKIQISDYEAFTEATEGRPENFLARIHWGDWDSSTQGEDDLLALNVYQSSENFYWNFENNGEENTMGIERDGVYYNIAYRTHNVPDPNYGDSYFLFRQIDPTPYGDFIIQLRDYVGSAETRETRIVPGGTYIYTQAKWTTINSVYELPENGFNTSAETISFVQNIKADFARGRYPQIYHRRFVFNMTGIGADVITFENMHNYNALWVVYLSDTDGNFGTDGFNEAGYRFDQGAIVNDPDIGTICVYVGPNGDFWYQHRGANELYNEASLCRVAVKGCEGDFSAEYGFGSIIYARKVTVSDVTTYTWSLIVPTDTGVMKGVWHTTNIDDGSTYVLDSWTSL